MRASVESWPLDRDGPADWPFDPFPESALESPIGRRFDEIAARYPARLAISDGTRSLTYAQLAADSRRIAAAVEAGNSAPGPVAILLPHDARFPAAILGVLAAGRACVALDADHPVERNRLIAAHAEAVSVVTAAALICEARTLFPGTIPIIAVEEPGADSGRPPAVPEAGDVAHIIYTSGSTGAPKGVFQNHRGVLHDIMQSVNTAHVSAEDRIALFYPPTVIAGLRTLLTAILTGASGIVLPPATLGPSRLAREIDARGITILRSSPTLCRHIVDSLEPGKRLESVRLVSLGGERVDWSDVDVFERGFTPHAVLSVHLGATECWTLHSHWYIDRSLRGVHRALPVGRSIADRAVSIVDEEGNQVPDGEVGEVVVASRYIALGYWKEPDLTARSFGTDPADASKRVYRTGDLAQRLPDGLLGFVGRKDQQIKLHGYRIEPNEVEQALKSCPGVSDAAVVVRTNEAGVPLALIGYAQLRADSRGLLPRHLLAILSRRLAPYMMPAEIVLLDALPWLANFKIDRRRLAQIDACRTRDAADDGSSDLVRELIRIFEKIVKVSGATAGDNLLSMGGDSVQALELVAEIERCFQTSFADDPDVSTRSIAEWARAIASARAPEATVEAR